VQHLPLPQRGRGRRGIQGENQLAVIAAAQQEAQPRLHDAPLLGSIFQHSVLSVPSMIPAVIPRPPWTRIPLQSCVSGPLAERFLLAC
jgi:hypothetical protein